MLSRSRAVAALAGLLVLALAAAIALSRGSEPTGAQPASASAPATAAATGEQGRLTGSRAQDVEPVAGESGDGAAPPTDPGLDGADSAPAGPASSTHSTQKIPQYHGPTHDVAVSDADVLKNGIALPPIEAPEEVRNIVRAGNQIARTPYLWGGGHGRWLDKGYDCSGSISYALASAGLLNAPLDSGRLMSWGKPGKGKWITIYANAGHVFMFVAGVRFDTSGTSSNGSRWQANMRSTGGFVARHPAGF